MERFKYWIFALVSSGSTGALAGCVTGADLSRDNQQMEIAEEPAIGASSSAASSSDPVSDQQVLDVKGDWGFAECCRIILPSDVQVFSGPSTIDGPSTYVVRRDDQTVSITVLSGPFAIPAGGEIQQSDNAITYRRYVRDNGETAIFAADKTLSSSPLDKKTITFAANDKASVVLLRGLIRTMNLIAPFEPDRERR